MSETVIERIPVPILYTNWRGETAVRKIVPHTRHPVVSGKPSLWFGSTQWYPEPQWLLTAVDVEKGAVRDWALSGIKAWGEEAVSAALASTARAGAGAGDWQSWIAERIACSEGYLRLAHQNGTDNPYARGRISALEEMRHRLSAVPASPISTGSDDDALRILRGLEQELGTSGAGETFRKALALAKEAAAQARAELASAPAPAERGVEIKDLVGRARLQAASERAIYGDDAGELYDELADAIVSALSQADTAGRSEKGEGEDEGRRAIRFAMGLEDHWDRFEFLNAFIGGDLSEWPEFTKPEPAPAQSPSTSDREG